MSAMFNSMSNRYQASAMANASASASSYRFNSVIRVLGIAVVAMLIFVISLRLHSVIELVHIIGIIILAVLVMKKSNVRLKLSQAA